MILASKDFHQGQKERWVSFLPQLTFVVTNNGLGIAGATAGDAKVASQRRPSPLPMGNSTPRSRVDILPKMVHISEEISPRGSCWGGGWGGVGVVLLSQKFTGFWLWYVAILSFCKSLSKALVLCPKPLPKSSWGEKMILTILISADTRAHNLCHDNRQLIVIAINRNHSASKINCN